MQMRNLGAQGLVVSAVGLGAMPMVGVAGMRDMYGAADEAESIATLHRALEIGVAFIDTAEVYGPYANEELLGRALKGRRDKAIIATKFGFNITREQRIAGADSRPEHIRTVLDASLKRLQTDVIDLWYQHRVDPAVPIEDVVGEMARAVEAGKVRYLGLSEAGPETIRRAHAVHPISALQSEYSLWERGIEDRILPLVRELQIGFVPYSPLGRGFLTGAVPDPATLPAGDYRKLDPRLQGENYVRNRRIVEAIQSVAARHRASAAQIAIAWLLAQGPDVVPIPGTKRRRWLEENAAAVEITLSHEDRAQLNEAAPPGATAGDRYGASGMAMVER
jgi:aryl-alcohol dehydrogenase-like predicted oxidoreductase